MIKKGNLRAFAQGDHVDPNEFLTLPCDILAPCAVDRVITGKNAGQIKCRILAEGANGPTTPGSRPDSRPALGRSLRDPRHSVQRRRRDRFVLRMGPGPAGVSVVGDRSDRQTFPHSRAFVCPGDQTREGAQISHRTAAMATGVERVIKAKQVRGLFP